jgi:hypothetical protein
MVEIQPVLNENLKFEHYKHDQDVPQDVKDFYEKLWIKEDPVLQHANDPLGALERLEVFVVREDTKVVALRTFGLRGNTSTSITAPHKRGSGIGTYLINKSIETIIAHHYPTEPVIRVYPVSTEGLSLAEKMKKKYADKAHIVIRSSPGL